MAMILKNIEAPKGTNLTINVKSGNGAMSSGAGSEKSENAVRSTNVQNGTDVGYRRIVLVGLRGRSAAIWRRRTPEMPKNGRFRKFDGDGDGELGGVNPRDDLVEDLFDRSKEVPVEIAYGRSESMAGDRGKVDQDGF